MLEDMLRGCVLYFLGSWDRYIPLMEFSYNKGYQSSIGMAPYEALYGRKCRTPICWTNLNEHKVIGPNIVRETEEKVQVIQQRLKAASDKQKLYAYLKRKDIEYEVRDKVFLKVSPWRKVLRFGKKGKLSLKFIGPYEILEKIGLVAYCLALPSKLAKYIMCSMSRCFGDTVLMNLTFFQYKIYKCNQTSLLMKSQKQF